MVHAFLIILIIYHATIASILNKNLGR